MVLAVGALPYLDCVVPVDSDFLCDLLMFLNMKDYPCHGCTPPKRYPGCHGKCKEFLERKQLDAARQKRQELDRIAFDVRDKRRHVSR